MIKVTLSYLKITNNYFFRSNLAAIFGLQQKFTDSHSSKQTTSTKENTQYSVQQTASASKTEVLTAKAVHAFQL